MLITHDLGVIAESVSKVVVMYAGELLRVRTWNAFSANLSTRIR